MLPTVVSLLLMLATAALWVDSYEMDISLPFAREGVVARSVLGQIEFGYRAYEPVAVEQDVFSFLGIGYYKTSHLMLVYGPGNYTGTFNAYALTLPHWFLTLIFAILPAIWLFKWNRRRKLGPNACPGCAYDLTGNETGVCSECGATTKAEAAKA